MTSDAPPAPEIYVYYRVARSTLGEAADAARGLFAELERQHPGLHSRLLVRAGDADAEATLMEIHRTDAPLSGPVLASLLQRMEHQAAALGPWLRGSRHVEVFHGLEERTTGR